MIKGATTIRTANSGAFSVGDRLNALYPETRWWVVWLYKFIYMRAPMRRMEFEIVDIVGSSLTVVRRLR